MLVQIPETSKAKTWQLPFSKYKFKHQLGSSIENPKSSLTSKDFNWLDSAAQDNFQEIGPSLPENYVPQGTIDDKNGMGRDYFAEEVKMGVKKKMMPLNNKSIKL